MVLKSLLCTYPGCSQDLYFKGFCKVHYNRARKGIPMDRPFNIPFRQARKLPPFNVSQEIQDGIQAAAEEAGVTPYQQVQAVLEDWYTRRLSLGARTCTWAGCSLAAHADKLCRDHYLLAARHRRKNAALTNAQIEAVEEVDRVVDPARIYRVQVRSEVYDELQAERTKHGLSLYRVLRLVFETWYANWDGVSGDAPAPPAPRPSAPRN